MLPVAHRLTASESFRTAVRRGGRSGSRTVVLHLHVPSPHPGSVPATGAPARVGLVVSKAVGPSVVRNRVKRRLRHLMRDRLELLPPASLLVIRAQPAAAAAGSQELVKDLDRCLGKVVGSAGLGMDPA